MIKWLVRASVGVAPLLLGGCATIVQVGEFKLVKESWELAEVEVKRRASFELKCPQEQLKLTVLAALGPPSVSMNWPKQIGVDGCGHRLVYVDAHGSWVLNSSDAEAK